MSQVSETFCGAGDGSSRVGGGGGRLVPAGSGGVRACVAVRLCTPARLRVCG